MKGIRGPALLAMLGFVLAGLVVLWNHRAEVPPAKEAPKEIRAPAQGAGIEEPSEPVGDEIEAPGREAIEVFYDPRAEAAPEEAEPAPAPQETLRVEVFDALAGAFLPGAVVELSDGAGETLWTGKSGPDGSLELPWRWDAEQLVLTAKKPRMAPLASLRWGAGEPPAGPLRLYLARAGTLRVRITDERGEPMPGSTVAVRVIGERMPEDLRALPVDVSPTTAEQTTHRARFPGLPVGSPLRVRARTPLGNELSRETIIHEDTRSAELRLMLRPVSPWQVLVADASGKPLPKARVGVDDLLAGTTNAQGRVSLSEVYLGSAEEIWVYCPGYAMAWQPPPASAGVIRFELAPQSILDGDVVDKFDVPRKGVRLTPLLGSKGSLALRLARGRRLVAQLEQHGIRTDEQGGFRIHGLPSQTLDLEVRPAKDPSFVLEGVRPDTKTLRIVLPDQSDYGTTLGITLAVRVLDAGTGAPIPGAEVTAFRSLTAEERVFAESAATPTDESGQARIAFAREGPFWVQARADGYLPRKTDTEVYPIGHHELELALTRSGVLRLTVLQRNGHPASGIHIRALDEHGTEVLLLNTTGGVPFEGTELVTDAEGAAGARLAPGKHKLRLWAGDDTSGDPLVSKEFTLEAGTETFLELRLP
jgi:hypothetical protein